MKEYASKTFANPPTAGTNLFGHFQPQTQAAFGQSAASVASDSSRRSRLCSARSRSTRRDPCSATPPPRPSASSGPRRPCSEARSARPPRRRRRRSPSPPCRQPAATCSEAEQRDVIRRLRPVRAGVTVDLLLRPAVVVVSVRAAGLSVAVAVRPAILVVAVRQQPVCVVPVLFVATESAVAVGVRRRYRRQQLLLPPAVPAAAVEQPAAAVHVPAPHRRESAVASFAFASLAIRLLVV